MILKGFDKILFELKRKKLNFLEGLSPVTCGKTNTAFQGILGVLCCSGPAQVAVMER